MSYALITGASKGIGKAIAYNLAARKINLVLVARSENLLSTITVDLKQQYKVEVQFLCIDLADENAAETIIEWITKKSIAVNILINNAGYGLSGKFEKYSANEHAAMMQVNITSLVKLTSFFLPLLKQQKQSYNIEYCKLCGIPGSTLFKYVCCKQIFCCKFFKSTTS